MWNLNNNMAHVRKRKGWWGANTINKQLNNVFRYSINGTMVRRQSAKLAWDSSIFNLESTELQIDFEVQVWEFRYSINGIMDWRLSGQLAWDSSIFNLETTELRSDFEVPVWEIQYRVSYQFMTTYINCHVQAETKEEKRLYVTRNDLCCGWPQANGRACGYIYI